MSRYRERDLPPRDMLLHGRERSPLRDRYDDPYLDRYDRALDPYERDRDDLRRRDLYYEDRLPPLRGRYDDQYLPEDDYRQESVYRDRERERERERERDRDRDRRDPLDRGRSRDILDREKDPRDARDAYDRRAPRHPEPPLSDPVGPASAPPPLPPTDTSIDCEILLMGKHLRDYADIVERRVKALSLNTGLLLISNEGSLTQALEDVTQRKVLYAIILTSQNELHRSVTLNILHGSPQEHRNMPLEDALALVDRNFSTYLQDRAVPSKSSSSSALPAVPAPLPGEPPLPRSQPPLPPTPQPVAVPPAPPAPTALIVPAVELTIPQLINLLADRKQLTLSEMDRVISHLQAVRRKMAIEQGLNPDPPVVPAATAGNTLNAQPKVGNTDAAPAKQVDKHQAELQAKILSIFNPSGSSTSTATVAKTTMATGSMLGMTSSTPKAVPKPNAAIPFSYGGSLSSVHSSSPSVQTTPSLVNTQTNKVASDINLDSPDMQKVLDKLILSGPTMLKKLATSANGTASSSTLSKTQASNKAIKDLKSRIAGSTPKPPGLSKEESDAQLRAAQQAALQTLQQQQHETAARTLQVQMGQQSQMPQAAMQNQYQQPMVQYPQPAQYQQQQAPYQQQQAQFQQQQFQQQQYQAQQALQQPTMPMGSSGPKPLLQVPTANTNLGSGWPRGWKPPGVQPTGSQQGFQPGSQPGVQQNPYVKSNLQPNPGAAYQQQQQNPRMDFNRPHAINRSQPKPPGI